MTMTLGGDTTVRELLTKHPNAFDVLASHGMCQSCKDNPPPVPLHHFAEKHCAGDLMGLIKQIEEATHQEGSPRP